MTVSNWGDTVNTEAKVEYINQIYNIINNRYSNAINAHIINEEYAQISYFHTLPVYKRVSLDLLSLVTSVKPDPLESFRQITNALTWAEYMNLCSYALSLVESVKRYESYTIDRTIDLSSEIKGFVNMCNDLITDTERLTDTQNKSFQHEYYKDVFLEVIPDQDIGLVFEAIFDLEQVLDIKNHTRKTDVFDLSVLDQEKCDLIMDRFTKVTEILHEKLKRILDRTNQNDLIIKGLFKERKDFFEYVGGGTHNISGVTELRDTIAHLSHILEITSDDKISQDEFLRFIDIESDLILEHVRRANVETVQSYAISYKKFLEEKYEEFTHTNHNDEWDPQYREYHNGISNCMIEGRKLKAHREEWEESLNNFQHAIDICEELEDHIKKNYGADDQE